MGGEYLKQEQGTAMFVSTKQIKTVGNRNKQVLALCVIQSESCLTDRKTTRWRLYIGSLRFIPSEVNTWTERYLSWPQEMHCLTEASFMIGRFRALMGVNL